MPMVGCGYRDGIDIVAGQQRAEILITGVLIETGDLPSPFDMCGVHVAQCHDLSVRIALEAPHVPGTLATQADAANRDPLGWGGAPEHRGRNDGRKRSGHGGMAQKSRRVRVGRERWWVCFMAGLLIRIPFSCGLLKSPIAY